MAPNGGPWLCGEKISMADFFAAKFYLDSLINPESPLKDGVA